MSEYICLSYTVFGGDRAR